jgi:hypothetical protein
MVIAIDHVPLLLEAYLVGDVVETRINTMTTNCGSGHTW